MRTFEEIVAACKPILISGEMFNGYPFHDQQAVILPDWTGEEEAKYFDDLIEHWYDQDYWYCFDHDEGIVGFECESMGYEVKSYKEITP
jgi:hypothetical protein